MGSFWDSPLVGAGLGAGIELGGSLLSSHSARQQNREERQWQEYMASTQYTRAVSDMRRAGLNPAMIYGKGPMSAPVSGGARQSEGEAYGRAGAGIGSRAAGLALMKAQLEDVSSAAALKRQEKDESLARTEQARAQTAYTDWQQEKERNLFEMEYGGKSVEDWKKLFGERASAQLAHVLSENSRLSADAAEAVARKALVEVQKRMLEYGESAAEAAKKYWDIVGVYGVAAEKGTDLVAKLAGSFGLANLGRNLLKKPENVGRVYRGPNSAKAYNNSQ